MPTLVLIRHSKAQPAAGDDHQRVLAPKGRADAAAVRDWFLAKGLVPDRVVVSTSARTRETWQLADPGGAPPLYDARVYEAYVEDLREVIAETPEGTEVLVVVGHNPGVEQLASELDESPDARDVTNRGLPTSAVAVFRVGSWALADAELQEVAVPGR